MTSSYGGRSERPPGPPDVPTAHTWGVGGAGPGRPVEHGDERRARPTSDGGSITVWMREDWQTEVHLPDEDEPIVLSPGDVVTIEPRAEVVVHRQMPDYGRAGTRGQDGAPATSHEYHLGNHPDLDAESGPDVGPEGQERAREEIAELRRDGHDDIADGLQEIVGGAGQEQEPGDGS